MQRKNRHPKWHYPCLPMEQVITGSSPSNHDWKWAQAGQAREKKFNVDQMP